MQQLLSDVIDITYNILSKYQIFKKYLFLFFKICILELRTRVAFIRFNYQRDRERFRRKYLDKESVEIMYHVTSGFT